MHTYKQIHVLTCTSQKSQNVLFGSCLYLSSSERRHALFNATSTRQTDTWDWFMLYPHPLSCLPWALSWALCSPMTSQQKGKTHSVHTSAHTLATRHRNPIIKTIPKQLFSPLAFVLPSLIFAWRLTSVPALPLFSSCTVRVTSCHLPLTIFSVVLHRKVLKWKRACQGLCGSCN